MTDHFRVLGLMSGTSMDGLDCLLCDVALSDSLELEYSILDFKTYPYSEQDRNLIQSALDGDPVIIEDTSRRLTQLFKEYSINFLDGRKIDLLGSHGQTVAHQDGVSTLQIGNIAPLAGALNIPSVDDFRAADITAGGNGAPLVPFLDWLMYKNLAIDTITLNMGGIANVSWVPAGCDRGDVCGFDTGPGMALIDECALHFWNSSADEDGLYSKQGKIIEPLLDKLLRHEFVQKPPPKSTGRHEFGTSEFSRILRTAGKTLPVDLIRTLVAFTAKSISENINKYLKFRPIDTRMILCGGGTHHPVLMDDLQNFIHISEIIKSEETGLHQDIKEALLIAVLAVARIKNLPANMPGVTGARQEVLLGKLMRNHE